MHWISKEAMRKFIKSEVSKLRLSIEVSQDGDGSLRAAISDPKDWSAYLANDLIK
jgi:hypothetical protein